MNLPGARRATHEHAAGTDVSSSRFPGEMMKVSLMLWAASLQKQRSCNAKIASNGAATKIRTTRAPKEITAAIDALETE
jgi:hypothetical protein